jgi:hypothetical protein
MNENKVSGMDKILEEESRVKERIGKQKISNSIEQALAELETLAFEEQHEPWWEILRYWIQELRWRRIFWEKMGQLPEEEFKK